MRKNLIRISSILAGIVCLYACTDDYFEFDKIVTDEWNPEFAIPLVKSSLTLADILANEDTSGIVLEGDGGILEIIYEGKVKSQIGGTQIVLPNQTHTEIINNVLVVPGMPSVSIPYSIPYAATGGVEVDSMVLKAGNLVMSVESKFQHNVNLVMDLPSIKDQNGNALQLNFVVPASNGSNTVVRSIVTNLSDYTIDMTNDGSGNPTFNSMYFISSITFNHIAGNPSSLSDELKVTSDFKNAKFKKFYGYIGQSDLELDEDTIGINLFKNFSLGDVFLDDPYMEVKILNSYGFPIDFELEDFSSINSSNTPPVIPIDISNTFPNNSISLNYPVNEGVDTTSVILDNNNSNIATIISSLLKKISYNSVAHPNPQGKTVRNYLSDTSAISMDVFLKLPFSGYAGGFVLNDTFDFKFDNAQNLKSGIVRVMAKNDFPLGAKLQLIFLDSTYKPLTKLFPNGLEEIIPGAQVNANGESILASTKNTDAAIDPSKLNTLKDTKYIILQAEMATTNYSPSKEIVKFKADYKLDVSIGIKANLIFE